MCQKSVEIFLINWNFLLKTHLKISPKSVTCHEIGVWRNKNHQIIYQHRFPINFSVSCTILVRYDTQTWNIYHSENERHWLWHCISQQKRSQFATPNLISSQAKPPKELGHTRVRRRRVSKPIIIISFPFHPKVIDKETHFLHNISIHTPPLKSVKWSGYWIWASYICTYFSHIICDEGQKKCQD